MQAIDRHNQDRIRAMLKTRPSSKVDRLLEEFLVNELMATIREINLLRLEKARLVKRLENIRKRA